MFKSNREVLILDYGMGNIASVVRMVERAGCYARVSNCPKELRASSRLILPGVGSFATAMRNLSGTGVIDEIKYLILEKKNPILGICLGMQLMADYSEEGGVQGFGIINGQVRRFSHADENLYKVPHVGWNTAASTKVDHPVQSSFVVGHSFYFVHSYYFRSEDSGSVVGKTTYGLEFDSVIVKNNFIGVQFHPEKSYASGDLLFRCFMKI
jgi:glutamine amidotransferase